MSSQKYVYNRQTLSYEVYKVPLRTRLFRAVGLCCAVLMTAAGMYAIAYTWFPSQKEQALMRELSEMQYQYSNVLDEMSLMATELSRIQERDAKIHRFMFNMEPIDEAIWSAGIGGSDRYAEFDNYPNGGSIMANANEMVDKLRRQLDIQSRSMDTLESHAMITVDRIESIPSIKPVRVDLLKRNVSMLSGFGMRLHPIHKVHRMHKGIDFTAPEGTAIQATGKGTVVVVDKKKTGYGRYVVIDHGYGYQTLYGHMDNIDVRVGDKVLKGQAIGTVGNTGTSTAPHCHYEVRINGRSVDPIHYCLDGLTPEQYKQVADRAASASQSFD